MCNDVTQKFNFIAWIKKPNYMYIMSNTLLLNRIVSEFQNASKNKPKPKPTPFDFKKIKPRVIKPTQTELGDSDDEIFDSVFSRFEDGKLPWYIKAKPRELSKLILSPKTVSDINILQKEIDETKGSNRPTVAIFCGPNGCGKSSAAQIISENIPWLLPMEDFQACEIHLSFETTVSRMFLNKSKIRPCFNITDVDHNEYGSELKTSLDNIRGCGLITIECNDEFCAFIKAVIKTKLPYTIIRFNKLDEHQFARACFNCIQAIDVSIKAPSFEFFNNIYSVCLGDVRSALIRLEMLWVVHKDWPELKDLDVSLSKMDHHKNTFEKVKMMCAAEDMDDFVERAYTLVGNNDFTVRVVSENIQKVLEARGCENDLEMCAKMTALISDSQYILGSSRNTDLTTMVGCIQPLHAVVKDTRCHKPVFPKMPSLLNAAKQESENRNPLKYMTTGETSNIYSHGGYFYKTQPLNISNNLLLSSGLSLSLSEWVHSQYNPTTDKEKKVVMPRDMMMCLHQMTHQKQKRSKRKAVNQLEPIIQKYLNE
jgi:hypothetical protein